MLSDHRFASSLTAPGKAANHAARPSPSNASARFRGTVNAPTDVILPFPTARLVDRHPG